MTVAECRSGRLGLGRGALLVLALAAGCAGLRAQVSANVAAAPGPGAGDAAQPAVPDTFQVGPEDLLSVYVDQMPDFSRRVRVDSQGEIRLPYMSTGIKVSGEDAEAISRQIGEALVNAELARAPQVQVTVLEVMSRPIVVSGAVKSPGLQQAVRPTTLLEVISRAGGMDLQAGSDVSVTRMVNGAPKTDTYSVNDLLRGDGVVPLLTGGETVRVPPARMVYSEGALQKPGAFPIQAGEPMSVLKVVAVSQGIRNPANQSGAMILRDDHAGHEAAIPVDIKKILKHAAPDLELQAGDILYVPDNKKAVAIASILSDAGQAAVIVVGYSLVH